MPHASPLTTDLCGVTLANPVVLAAGTAGVLDEMRDVCDVSNLGAIVTKSITTEERRGNPYPRITWTRAGMLNAIGLANPGLERWEQEIAPRIKDTGVPIIGSIAGDSIVDYMTIASAMNAVDALSLVELNVSCPNVHSGLEFGADLGALAELVSAVRNAAPRLKLVVKLSPVTVGTPNTIVDLARAAVDSGASALTLTNTVPAMGIDVRTRKPILANVTGGMSGPAIHPIVVRLVHQVHTALPDTPILAAGGVTRWEDAAEFVLAGATCVQIGAGTYASPGSPIKIAKKLERWVRRQGASHISELTGAVDLS